MYRCVNGLHHMILIHSVWQVLWWCHDVMMSSWESLMDRWSLTALVQVFQIWCIQTLFHVPVLGELFEHVHHVTLINIRCRHSLWQEKHSVSECVQKQIKIQLGFIPRYSQYEFICQFVFKVCRAAPPSTQSWQTDLKPKHICVVLYFSFCFTCCPVVDVPVIARFVDESVVLSQLSFTHCVQVLLCKKT